MNYEERKPLMAAVERLRRNRTLVCLMNFDRQSDPPGLPGVMTQFNGEVKESLFRVLKESPTQNGVDLFLYTRGGDTNAVWPIVSLIREFDPNFEVLVPFRCHSSGTLLAMGANRILLGPISELSPIDPTTGNQFNPVDPSNAANRLGISVEDVRSYKEFVHLLLDDPRDDANKQTPVAAADSKLAAPLLQRLTDSVHPLALGNVQRVVSQIRRLAGKLLQMHPHQREDIDKTIKALTTDLLSHFHMIDRFEAREILASRIAFMSAGLSRAVDALLRGYEETFYMRRQFFLRNHMANDAEKHLRFIGALCESRSRSYAFVTRLTVRQTTQLPPNVQVQLPPGQQLPMMPGLPRSVDIEVIEQRWMHNPTPQGITLE